MTAWACLQCDAHGVTAKSADDHMKDTRHSVTTATTPTTAAAIAARVGDGRRK